MFFCATPLAASLCGGTAAAGAAEGAGAGTAGMGGVKGGGASTLENSSYIIVETNFRVRETAVSKLSGKPATQAVTAHFCIGRVWL